MVKRMSRRCRRWSSPVLATVAVAAFGLAAATPAQAVGESIDVHVTSSVTDVGRCNVGGHFGDCSVATIYAHPIAGSDTPGAYTAVGHITDSAGNTVDSAGNSCSFVVPITFGCNTDGQNGSPATVSLFGTSSYCYGVRGTLTESLVHPGGAVVASTQYQAGCISGVSAGRPDTLYGGETMFAGYVLTSLDGRYTLNMQSDGNLVLRDPSGRAVWASGTSGNTGADAEMQNDGNFVIYKPGHIAIWATNTAGNSGARLVMQNDCNLVIYTASDQSRWQSNTLNCP